jgi:hypothetical protein
MTQAVSAVQISTAGCKFTLVDPSGSLTSDPVSRRKRGDLQAVTARVRQVLSRFR